MPSFRDIPETLRPLARPERDEPPSPPPPDPPAEQAVVDCGIYVDGERLPGTFSYTEAQSKVAELQLAGQEAFAWIGLHEPTEHQMQEVGNVFGLHPLAIEDAVCAHQRPKLERYDEITVPGAQDGQLRSARFAGTDPRGRRDRRDHDLRQRGFRGDSPARRAWRAVRRTQADGQRPRAHGAGPICGDARDRRLGGGPLPRRDHLDGG